MLMKSGKIINHILDYYAAASQKINLKTVPRSADKAKFVFTLTCLLFNYIYFLFLSLFLVLHQRRGNKHESWEHVQRTWVIFLEPTVCPRLGYSLADCSHAALASPRLFSRIIFSELTKPIKLNKLFKWRTVLRAYGFRCICTFRAYIPSWVS